MKETVLGIKHDGRTVFNAVLDIPPPIAADLVYEMNVDGLKYGSIYGCDCSTSEYKPYAAAITRLQSEIVAAGIAYKDGGFFSLDEDYDAFVEERESSCTYIV
ncbi:MAG: hypothetical protein NT016_00385 [Candidatus Aenigmarchaeota archaeon]|nr:hypothetical protein [Candidatus Aenigmarchaeota archaeon]